MCWAWGRVAPIRREKAEFLKEMHPKGLQRHVGYIYPLFSVQTNVTCWRSLAFLIVGQLKTVELVKTQANAPKESLVRF
jgi:hypothetical protein